MIDIKTMNRKETIRALRACATPGGTCGECPLKELSIDCTNDLLTHAADVLEASVSVQYE